MADLFLLFARNRSLLGKFRERLFDRRKAFLEEFVGNFAHHSFKSGHRGSLGDTRAHQAATQDAYFLNLHCLPISSYSSFSKNASSLPHRERFGHSFAAPLSHFSYSCFNKPASNCNWFRICSNGLDSGPVPGILLCASSFARVRSDSNLRLNWSPFMSGGGAASSAATAVSRPFTSPLTASFNDS